LTGRRSAGKQPGVDADTFSGFNARPDLPRFRVAIAVASYDAAESKNSRTWRLNSPSTSFIGTPSALGNLEPAVDTGVAVPQDVDPGWGQGQLFHLLRAWREALYFGATPRPGASSSTNASSSSDCKTGAVLSGTGEPEVFAPSPGRASLSSLWFKSRVCLFR
jgi:hypothetical protein